MLGIVRIGAYLVSALTVWQFFQGDTGFMTSPLHKHLALDPSNGMLLGVCAGISNYTGIDVTVLRFIWVLMSLYRGLGIGLYILAFLIMPANG